MSFQYDNGYDCHCNIKAYWYNLLCCYFKDDVSYIELWGGSYVDVNKG